MHSLAMKERLRCSELLEIWMSREDMMAEVSQPLVDTSSSAVPTTITRWAFSGSRASRALRGRPATW